MNKIIITSVILVVVLAGIYFLGNTTEETSIVSDPLNTTYLINAEVFTLIDGKAEHEIVPGSATKNRVTVFGNPTFGDIDGDGDDDAALILVNDPGGSGTFYYAAIAVNVDGEYKGTDSILLGDRIAPQTVLIQNNRAMITYADRGPDESFAIQPSIGKSLHLQFNPKTLRLIQVAVDFEGEADPDRMTLDMHTWRWIKTTYNNDTELIPEKEFTVTFKDDGTFTATTDCNNVTGSYDVEDRRITFNDMASTEMFCGDESQEGDFVSMLGQIQSFFFTSKGELIFDLKFDSGSSIFR